MRDKLAFASLAISLAALISAVFFGWIFASQASTFYVDLLSVAADAKISSVDMAKYMALLDKYQMAWYLPQLLGFVFAVIALIAGVVSFVLMTRRPS